MEYYTKIEKIGKSTYGVMDKGRHKTIVQVVAMKKIRLENLFGPNHIRDVVLSLWKNSSQRLKTSKSTDNKGTTKLAGLNLARVFGIPSRVYIHELITLWHRSPEVLLGSAHNAC
ncbi:hypothetical protein GH733_002202 [Mirounga leonina]|nr:hypothetical protein GH733_002202 [Mirounga leonina]